MVRVGDGGERRSRSARRSRDVAAMTVFTTHTPVAAGHDRFPAALVEEHLGKIREALHLSYDDFMGLGRVYPADPNEPFCMTVLALKLSRQANGVSALHGQVSRRMWHPLYPNRPEEEVPIGHITNGVHVQSWVAPQMHLLLDRHLGTDWPKRQRHPETWTGDPDDRGRRALGDAAGPQGPADRVRPAAAGGPGRAPGRGRRRRSSGRQGARPERPDDRVRPPVRHLQARRPGAPGRRSAGRDWSTPPTGRSSSSSPARPTPRTSFGKELIQNIVRLTRQEPFVHRIVFVEDYDMNVARQLVQGVDVWLNNPAVRRRPAAPRARRRCSTAP